MIGRLADAQRAVVLSGVPGADRASDSTELGDEAEPVAVTPQQVSSLIEWAHRERLVGLLWRALRTGELSIAPDSTAHLADEAVSSVDEAVVTAARSSLAAEATGLTAVLALRASGIEAVVFKGLATAHLDYADPTERSFFDADILVARLDLARAVCVLSDAGFRRGVPAMRPSWEHRFARAVELRYDDGVELDLHAALATGYFGVSLDHDRMRTECSRIELGGTEYVAFGPTARLLISCYAIVLSRGPGLRLYGDLVRQLLVTGADWREAAEWAGEGECVIAEALRRLALVLDVDHEAIEWAHTVVPSPTARRALDHAVAAERAGWSADARSALLALGMVDRARFVAGIAESRLLRRRR